jgi:hypothetical protein
MDRKEFETTAISLGTQRWQLVRWPDLTLGDLKTIAQSRIFNLSEIVAVSVVYFWVSWSVKATMAERGLSFFPTLIILLTIVYVAYISPVFIHRDSLAIRGLGPYSGLFIKWDNFLPALGRFGFYTFLGIAGLLLLGSWLKPGHLSDFDGYTFSLRMILYFFSAFMQDGLFFSFFLWRWQASFGAEGWVRASGTAKKGPNYPPGLGVGSVGWPAILANAVLFSWYHLPNKPVMALTLLMGIVWGKLFSRTPNLLAAALGHASMGTVLHLSLKISTKVGSTCYLGHKGFYGTVFTFVDPWICGRFQW